MMTQDLSTTVYGTCLQNLAHVPDDFSDEQVVSEKLGAIHNDPFAMELAFRLAIAEVSYLLGDSFGATHKSYGTQHKTPGDAWIQVTIICLEDKIFGKGRQDAILCHPMLEELPKLRNLRAARKDHHIVQVARRFQAAYETMSRLDLHERSNKDISSFDRKLKLISEPESLWIVLAGLSRWFLSRQRSIRDAQR